MAGNGSWERWGNLSTGGLPPIPTMGSLPPDPHCTFYPMPYILLKFYLITIFGSVLGVFAVLGNALLIYVFGTRPHFRQSCFLYMAGMATMDLLTGLCYILVISTSITFEYTSNIWLMDRWYEMVIPLNALSNVVMMASPYFLVVASLERYLVQFHKVARIAKMPARLILIAVVIAFSVVSKGTVYFELEIADMSSWNCTGLASKYLQPTGLRTDPTYDAVWCFYFRNVVTVFLPFLALLFLNLRIILADYCSCALPRLPFRRRRSDSPQPSSLMRQAQAVRYRKQSARLEGQKILKAAQTRKSRKERRGPASPEAPYRPVLPDRALLWAQRAKTRVRKANSRTLVVIVLEYLMCNSLSLFVTAWEHISIQTLLGEDYKDFYLVASDVISLLVVAACAIRLPTYLICDVTFRKELQYMLMGRKKAVAAAAASAYSNGDAHKRSDTQFTLLVMEVLKNKKRLSNGVGGESSVGRLSEVSPMLPPRPPPDPDESVVVFV